MAKKRGQSRKSKSTKATPDVDMAKVKDCAMLLMSPGEAADYLGISGEDFNRIMRKAKYQRAWRDGRLAVRKSIHASLLVAAKDGKVPAIRLALEKIDDNPDFLSSDSSPNDAPTTPPKNATNTPGILANFRNVMQSMGGKAG